jgi:hypothetical protein
MRRHGPQRLIESCYQPTGFDEIKGGQHPGRHRQPLPEPSRQVTGEYDGIEYAALPVLTFGGGRDSLVTWMT